MTSFSTFKTAVEADALKVFQLIQEHPRLAALAIVLAFVIGLIL